MSSTNGVRALGSIRGGRWLAVTVLTLLGSFLISTSASADPCVVPDNGGGTITLPPAGCAYLSPDDVHMIIDGLPPGTTIELAPIHKDFICNEQAPPGGSCTLPIPPGVCEVAGGGLGGNGDCFDSVVEFEVTGTGALAGFNRIIQVPLFTEVHTGPRNPGDPVQTFPTEMIQLQGALFGDPDFDTLQVQAGLANGLPSPGQTTLTVVPRGYFNVDSFFYILSRIDFLGAPGSALDGLSGSTQATIRMQAGEPAANSNPCIVPDNGSGTVTLPPAGCEYLSPNEVHEIINGLPAGTTIELAAIHKDFICRGDQGAGTCSSVIPPGLCEVPGGGLGGNIDCFDSVAELTINGTGALTGYQRNIFLPLFVEVHTGPRSPTDDVQEFPTEMVQLQGTLFGDPDFEFLQIIGGAANGHPSPGQTTLTRLPSGDFNVDSFFDIEYRIEFQGAPGSPLEGMGGSTTNSIRMETGSPADNQVPGLVEPMWVALAVMAMLAGAAVVLRQRATS